MKTENVVLMSQARESLKGKWVLAVGTFFLYHLIIIIIQSINDVGPFIGLIISGPFLLGITIFSLTLSRNQNPHLEQIFQGFKRFGTAFVAYLLMLIFTILWTLLLIVPGIIASLSYSMTFFIIADEPTISANDAIKKSKKMMYGYKLKFLYLNLRFLGWAILAILTAGIGFLWLMPYFQVTYAKFYEDIKNKLEPVVVSTPVVPPVVLA